jgi:hypothetical protein
MANKFGYSGNLGYNSYRVSRSGKCCCPPKGDKGDDGLDGLKGDKGDIGEKGVKGNTGSTAAVTQYGLFIYEGGSIENTNNYILSPSMNPTHTTNYGKTNLNFLNGAISSSSLISFKNLKNTFPVGGVAEFYAFGKITPNNNNSVIECDLSSNVLYGASLQTILIDNRGLPNQGTGVYTMCFGPVSYKVSSSETQDNIIHFDNEYFFRIKNRATTLANVPEDFKLMIKFRPI